MAKSKSKPEEKRQSSFHLEFLNSAQKMAWAAFDQHDVLFLLGPAGTGKSHLATAFAVGEILAKRRKKIILTRPIVEAGESLGYLPGTLNEKIAPYMIPIYDCIRKMVGGNAETSPQREIIDRAVEEAPLAYLRGRTFDDSVCIFDEAQNSTRSQLKLFLTRFGQNSKVIVTGDPTQSDIGDESGLMDVVKRLESLPGVGVVYFRESSIVRHRLIGPILERLQN